MTLSTIGPLLLTTPFAASLLELTVALLPLIAKVGRHIVAFRRDTVTPAFDLSNANIGPALDITAAVQSLFDRAHVGGKAKFVRMTVAQRKGVLTFTDFRSSFWTDTVQDPVAGTATINLAEGLVAPSSRINETVGNSGDNVFAPITFGVDAMFISRPNLK